MPWTDTPDSNALTSPRRGTWRSTQPGIYTPRRGSWHSRLEKVAPFGGQGNLTAIMKPRTAFGVAFVGSGALSAGTSQVTFRLAPFSGEGLPTGSMSEKYLLTVQLSGEGHLSSSVVANLPVAVSALFSGVGTLSEFEEFPDGLSAVLTSSLAPSDGLSATMMALFGSNNMTPQFAGSGILAALLSELYSQTGTSGGVGTMTATAFARYASVSALSGSGTLTAGAYERYSINVGFGD